MVTKIDRKKPNRRKKFDALTGSSPQMRLVYQRIVEAASVDVPVLILGESGTGKELVAESIHKRSSRKNGPFVPVNTGAISKDLVASELFGHQRGSFTGATDTKAGKFEQAYGGSLFLDEISTMDEITQISLLRVLESDKIQRVGGKRFIKADVRIISASNEDLLLAVESGKHIIREDLYYRINVFTIMLPPLKNREGDIAVLAREFLREACAEFGKNRLSLSADALEVMENYSWPGNVRELKNVIQRAVLICKNKSIRPEHLPQRITNASYTVQNISIPVGTPLKDAEKIIIQKTLAYTKGNKQKAALLLGISRRALYDKLKLYDI